MESSGSERKRKPPETAGGSEEEEAAAAAAAEADADEEDEEERWVGPLPGEAAQAKKRRGNGRSGAFARRPLLWGAAREASVAVLRAGSGAVGSPPGRRPRREWERPQPRGGGAWQLGRPRAVPRAPGRAEARGLERCHVRGMSRLWRDPWGAGTP